MRRFFLVVAASLCLALVPGLEAPAQDLDPAFSRARDAVYDQNKSAREIDSLLAASRRTIVELSDRRQRLYWLARLESLAGYMELHVTQNMEAAERHFQDSLRLSREALELGEFSEGYRLQSSDISYLCAIKGTGYAIANGPKIERRAREAIRLDPHNGKALIVLATTEIYVPRLLGGDPRRGIELMQEALRSPELDKEDLFDAYSRMGIAFGKLRNFEKARDYLNRSLALFPNNIHANEELEKLS